MYRNVNGKTLTRMISSKYHIIQKDTLWVFSNLIASSQRLREVAASKEFFQKTKEILVGSYNDLKIEVFLAYKNFFYCSSTVNVETMLREHEDVGPVEQDHRNCPLELRPA
jgi:hypothetical protein